MVKIILRLAVLEIEIIPRQSTSYTIRNVCKNGQRLAIRMPVANRNEKPRVPLIVFSKKQKHARLTTADQNASGNCY